MVKVGVYRTFYDVVEIPNALRSKVPEDVGETSQEIVDFLDKKKAWPQACDMQELEATFIRLE
jgi:hypothetical protein